MPLSLKSFTQQFQFQPQHTLHIGIERECFLSVNGSIAPISPQVLAFLNDAKRFGYELSACQIEERCTPCQLENLGDELLLNERILQEAEEKLGFKRRFLEVGPPNMPLDIYPDPSGRYQRIVKKLPKKILQSACRVAGTHFHIGMSDKESAIRVYNRSIHHLDELCEMGDNSNGERLRLYKTMAPDYAPQPYESWRDFHDTAIIKGFDSDPRKCWHLIRISIHGTVEFRTFGVTDQLETLCAWARRCRHICQKSL